MTDQNGAFAQLYGKSQHEPQQGKEKHPCGLVMCEEDCVSCCGSWSDRQWPAVSFLLGCTPTHSPPLSQAHLESSVRPRCLTVLLWPAENMLVLLLLWVFSTTWYLGDLWFLPAPAKPLPLSYLEGYELKEAQHRCVSCLCRPLLQVCRQTSVRCGGGSSTNVSTLQWKTTAENGLLCLQESGWGS